MGRRGRDRALYELVLTGAQLRASLALIGLALLGSFAAGGYLGYRWARSRALAAQDAALAVRQSVHQITQAEPPRDPEAVRVEAAIEELIPASPASAATGSPRPVNGRSPLGEEPAMEEEPEAAAPSAPEAESEAAAAAVVEPFSLEPDRSGGFSKGLGSWLVQVLATPSELEAKQLADRLALDGFPAFVSVTRDGDRTFFRVRVGTFGAKTDADRAAAELRRKHRLDTWVFE